MSAPQPPSRREILKPVELLVFAAVAGIFTGLVTLMVTRDMTFALIGFGIAFIVTLVFIAMFALTVKPDDMEKKDIHDQDTGH
ncbi:hypothetical protein [Mycetocola zhujimingii]|uniref:Uncharacterized protein n=1 Tax=Mycetocola zhujimingii TaxID=2079792 RepID=A0A2U1TBQ7_9MICO|nr:hypothetical protein [Mycetocola zhujimingii]AWB87539.1 hypothetical protein C3E77_13615 [Mycetocola zhujimingii]PWC06321.1 hypothetical protein DF223_12000 [Mycetocola zhujimingii]